MRKIYEDLCYKDKRNPMYADLYDEDDNPTPRKDCFCDNCFHGIDSRALRTLELIEALRIAEQWFLNFTEDKEPYKERPAADLQTIMLEAIGKAEGA